MYTKSTKIANTVKTVFQQDSEIEENEGPINPVKIVKITDDFLSVDFMLFCTLTSLGISTARGSGDHQYMGSPGKNHGKMPLS